MSDDPAVAFGLPEVDGIDAPSMLPVPSPVAFVGEAVADSLARRVKAVACTAPLHDLEANKVRRGGPEWSGLNCWELAFVAIDTVATRMDFDSGVPYDDVITVVATQAGHQLPQLSAGAHRDVGAWVVDGLVSGRAGDGFDAVYGRWSDDGYQASAWPFKLLTEHPDVRFDVCLRASDEAINVLVGALDTDVESAQVAAEAKLQNLIDRGLLDEAVATAQAARYLTIRYAEALRREVANTRLNVADVDWAERVPGIIEAALDHVLGRYRSERHILANIAENRDAATETRLRDRANQLISVVKDCQRRHQALHTRLVTIRREFRDAQDELLARPPADVVRVDIERTLLLPLLRLPVGEAAGPLAGFFARLSGPGEGILGDVDRLLDELSEPQLRADHLGVAVDEPELADLSREPTFDDAIWDLAEAALAELDLPTRLSALLARVGEAASDAGDRDGDGHRNGAGATSAERVIRACHLTALLAARAYDPDLAGARSVGRDRILVAVSDGTRLEGSWVTGDDLLLVPAPMVRDGETAL